MTHSILAKPEIKRPEDLRGKKVAVGRFGGNTHYFTIQALRKYGMDASRDIQTIQTGGGPETLAALVAGNVDAAAWSRRATRPRFRAGFVTSLTV